MRRKTIGVMGGLGPAATVEFMRHIVALTAGEPTRLLVDCDPTIPDVSASILGLGPSCAASLVDMARGLERAGAEVIVLACNAAHHYEAQIRAAITVPFVGMIAVACSRIRSERPDIESVGLLAAESCLVSGVYQLELARNGMRAVLLPPEDNARFAVALAAIRAGSLGEETRSEVLRAIDLLADAGAQGVVLGCTEIPLVLAPDEAAIYAVDPARTLAEALIATQ